MEEKRAGFGDAGKESDEDKDGDRGDGEVDGEEEKIKAVLVEQFLEVNHLNSMMVMLSIDKDSEGGISTAASPVTSAGFGPNLDKNNRDTNDENLNKSSAEYSYVE